MIPDIVSPFSISINSLTTPCSGVAKCLWNDRPSRVEYSGSDHSLIEGCQETPSLTKGSHRAAKLPECHHLMPRLAQYSQHPSGSAAQRIERASLIISARLNTDVTIEIFIERSTQPAQLARPWKQGMRTACYSIGDKADPLFNRDVKGA